MMRLLTRALLWSLAALLVAGAAAGQKITGVTGPGGSLSNPVTPAQGGTGGDFSSSTGVLYDAAGTFSAIACASGLLQGGTPPTCTTTPALGTPASGVATNLIGTAVGLTAGAATALAADPTDCSAGTVALGINAAGTAQCTATPSVTSLQGIIGNVTPAAGTFTTVVGSTSIASPIHNNVAGNPLTIGTTDGQPVLIKSNGTNRVDLVNNHWIFGSDVDLNWAQSSNPTDTIDTTISRAAVGILNINTRTFAQLLTPVVGSFTYCTDCDAPAAGIMATCTSAGTKTGAWAFRVNATPVWGCIGI